MFLHGGIGMLIYYPYCQTYTYLIYSQIFPNYTSARRSTCRNSALARIKEKRLELRAITNNALSSDGL